MLVGDVERRSVRGAALIGGVCPFLGSGMCPRRISCDPVRQMIRRTPASQHGLSSLSSVKQSKLGTVSNDINFKVNNRERDPAFPQVGWSGHAFGASEGYKMPIAHRVQAVRENTHRFSGTLSAVLGARTARRGLLL